jgi:hypothetical protein
VALAESGGQSCLDWNAAVRKALLAAQVTDTDACARGSWDAFGPWGAQGGRVYATSLACLCLAAPHRYDIGLSRGLAVGSATRER